ncbi:hypothetical protein TNCV_1901421 [Trichonephila clavipes]|nr:hypothetical protein TNCV_1901421 [Trichonephila clavipes]
MIGIVFKASADVGEKLATLCNPAECHPPLSFPSPLLKKCSLFNDFQECVTLSFQGIGEFRKLLQNLLELCLHKEENSSRTKFQNTCEKNREKQDELHKCAVFQ